MTKATLVIFRHGETDYNVNHLMTGQRDIPLNATGVEQAKEAGRLLSGVRFDKVFASDLSRSFNTAAYALEASGSHLHLLAADGTWTMEKRKEISEVDTGDFTGRSHRNDPEIQQWKRRYDLPLPNGESDKQAVARVGDFYRAEVLPRLEKGENVLVVVHAGIVRAFDMVLGFEDIPQDGIAHTGNKRRIPNATPLVVEFENGAISHSYYLENPKEIAAANQNASNVKKPKVI